MAIIAVQGSGFVKVGCKDPIALNYDPTATEPCTDCCEYSVEIIGCNDPLALNYDSTATKSCTDCCIYQPISSVNKEGKSDIFIIGDTQSNQCVGPFSIKLDGEVTGVNSYDCCNSNSLAVLQQDSKGYEYYWNGEKCYYTKICPTNVTCVDCFNLDWWNDTYMSKHNNQSLLTTSPVLWSELIDLVTNSGQTFYVNSTTGDLLNDICCTQVKGIFEDGICYCSKGTLTETFTPRCISTIEDFNKLISTTKGYDFLFKPDGSKINFQIIGPSLGLSTTDTNFIVSYINDPKNKDINKNDLPDNIESKILVANALTETGGFYVNFSNITNEPIMVTEEVCNTNGGFWDGSVCMCKPLQGQCDIVLTDTATVNISDFYNNNIQIITNEQGQPIGESCCNKIAKDNDLQWVWQSPYCYAYPGQTCLPVVFGLNDKSTVKVPPCQNDLEVSIWVYFGKPNNPCQPIPVEEEIIVIDGKFCDVELTPNTKDIVVKPEGELPIKEGKANQSQSTAQSQQSNTTCCYNNENPILARISLTNSVLNSTLVQVKEYNSVTDSFDKWIQLKALIPNINGITLNIGVNLEIYNGLNCCCEYDIYIDDIAINCSTDVTQLLYTDVDCPGFELTKVIDNKKSWVYNPGLPSIGTSTYDIIERNDGNFGLLNGQGTINRTFAPSLDAEIPWRYTNYFNQSSTLEKHSNLVLNSKELWMTFDMCADCPVSSTTISCLSGYTYSASTCYDNSGNTVTTAITKTVSVKYLTILELENYKKQFQSFWIPFMEQFIPATTIWVAGERWCNDPCPVINVCDYDFELVASASSITIVGGLKNPGTKKNEWNKDVPTPITSQITMGLPKGIKLTKSDTIIPLTNIGLTTTQKITLTKEETNIDIQAYKNKFTAVETIIE